MKTENHHFNVCQLLSKQWGKAPHQIRASAILAYSALMFVGDKLLVRRSPLTHAVACPICGIQTTRKISFPSLVNSPASCQSLPEIHDHLKHLCTNCGHLFASWIDGNLQKTGKTYQQYHGFYNSEPLYQENERAPFQLALLRYILPYLSHLPEVRILDFGCGANTSPTITMRAEGYDVRCCDILDGYPYDDQIFFRYKHHDARWLGAFDAIVSLDVMEHLGNTVDAWCNLNRLLKPNGLMAHCFPTLWTYPLRHSYFACPLHICIFSKQSLHLLMNKTGFSLETMESFPSDVPFVYRFRKIREV